MHGDSCASIVQKLHTVMTTAVKDQLLNAQVTSVAVTGTTAVATIAVGGSSTNAHLRKVGGSWLLDIPAGM
jgi:hypothetical protein